MSTFEHINSGYNRVFEPGRLSIGLVAPIEHYGQSAVPNMNEHLQRVQQIEQLGFKALWLRDIPFHVPSFGDAGQLFDPFTYLGFLAGQTQAITLGISSIALPLHHPVHVAKSAATIDQLSGGRMILGVASGDRPDEYPAMDIDFEQRGALFRDAFAYIRKAATNFPKSGQTYFGQLNGQIDVLPKPTGSKLPMLMTGSSRQSLEWNAKHGDGWMYYPRNLLHQERIIREWRELVAANNPHDKPFMQPLYIDLLQDDDAQPQPIHLGLRLGVNHLNEYLQQLQQIGVNHLALNLRFNAANIEETLERLAKHVLPKFHHQQTEIPTP